MLCYFSVTFNPYSQSSCFLCPDMSGVEKKEQARLLRAQKARSNEIERVRAVDQAMEISDRVCAGTALRSG